MPIIQGTRHMKRIFHLLLIVLLLLSVIGTAEASTHKKKKKAVAAVEMTNSADADGRERASSFDRTS